MDEQNNNSLVTPLFDVPPFSWSQAEKDRYYDAAIAAMMEKHSQACPEFARLAAGFGGKDVFLPVRLFKQYSLRSVPESEVVKTMTSSGTTGQTPSKIFLDRNTSANQSKVLMKICSDFLGSKRLPMLIIDSRATIKDRNLFSARGAGILGFSMLGRTPTYALDDNMHLDLPAVEAFLEKNAESDIFVFGFTFMIWEHFYRELAQKGVRIPLDRGILIHGGGWKKLLDQAVDNETFKQKLNEVCGIKKVYNYYGMVEQTGSIFMECECGRLHASNYSDVIIRDPQTFEPLPVGQRGLIQLVSLLPESYPGFSLLSEDEGELTGVDDCPCGRKGKTFKIYGRIKNAEVRGCSDTYSVNKGMGSKEQNSAAKLSVLCGKYDCSVTSNPVSSVEPYSPLVCEFLDELSRRLRSDAEAKRFPDVQTFSFWCRKASIAKMKSAYEDGKRRLGRGTVFHIAPSNVPINFAFSYVFGLLAGNANVVRVPSKPFPQTDVVCRVVKEIFADPKWDGIAKSTAFVQYERSDEITAQLSAQAQARIIWGGDATIRHIQQFPIDVRGVEVSFADRYSFCMINADAVVQATDEQIVRLGQSFYNDTYLMDQNACSSPHLVVWSGADVAAAQERFWSAVETAAKKYDLPPVKAVDKLTKMCCNCIDFEGVGQTIRQSGTLWRAPISILPQNLDQLRGQFGLFYEYKLSSLDELSPVITSRFQTLTTFGWDKSQLADWIVERGITGVDRIVNIGDALDIGVIWDGYDIVKTLSRIVTY